MCFAFLVPLYLSVTTRVSGPPLLKEVEFHCKRITKALKFCDLACIPFLSLLSHHPKSQDLRDSGRWISVNVSSQCHSLATTDEIYHVFPFVVDDILSS